MQTAWSGPRRWTEYTGTTLVCCNCASDVRLARHVGRDLQRHQPVGQVALPGEVDPAERPPAQLGAEAEAEEAAADRGEARQRVGQPLGRVRVGPVQVAQELGVLGGDVAAFEQRRPARSGPPAPPAR